MVIFCHYFLIFTLAIHVLASVPGDIYADLERSKIIKDPLYRFNDVLTRWVAYDNWTLYKDIHGKYLQILYYVC